MEQPTERKAFNFYKSYFDVYNELSAKDKLLFIDALLKRQFYGIEPKLKGMSKFAYISQKHNIDAQVNGYISKTKTSLTPPIKPPTVPPTPQEEEEEKVKEKDNIDKLFFEFWNKYHKITGRKKEDKETAIKYYNKLTTFEQLNAHSKIQDYSNTATESQYRKKAYKYLRDKNFNDEFEVKKDLSKLKKHVPKMKIG